MSATPQIWGILNITPDSFSDGGRFACAEDAIRAGLAMVADGADVLDIGGESTRPGAAPISRETEIGRVVPVIAGLRAAGVAVPLSIDTRHAGVAAASLKAGASIVNDVSAAQDERMFEVVAGSDAALVLMHMSGTPRTMQQDPRYADVVGEVRTYLLDRLRAAQASGIPASRLWIDPGLGFGKKLEHNLALLRQLEVFVGTGHPVLLGASRKSFLAALTSRPNPRDRLAGSLACALRARDAGVRAVRVHDVGATRDLFDVSAAIR